MANEKEVLITAEGLKKLEAELEELKVFKRKEMAEKIKQARAFGDLSENSEYDEARNEQAQVEARISQIEGTIKIARVVEDTDKTSDTVGLGTHVKILDMEFDEEEEYTIVGSSEADPSQNRLSYESPVGKALMGKKAGDVVEAVVPSGTLQFKILEIS